MSHVTLSPAPRRVLADVVATSALANVVLVTGAAALVGLLAQISIPLGFTPVPVTGQTLGVLLCSAALGWRRASLSMALYLVAGMAGVPWFAGHASGNPVTLGYVVGFVAAGATLGALAQRGNDRSIVRAVLSMVVAEAIIYTVGVSWLAVALHVSLAQALSLGFAPFVAGDVLKAAIAGVALPGAWRLVDKSQRSN